MAALFVFKEKKSEKRKKRKSPDKNPSFLITLTSLIIAHSKIKCKRFLKNKVKKIFIKMLDNVNKTVYNIDKEKTKGGLKYES